VYNFNMVTKRKVQQMPKGCNN